LRSIHQVIARNCAPVSRYLSPSRVATPLDVLDFPDPEGPSIATTTLELTAHYPASDRPNVTAEAYR
jgi:hypothetical protein